MVAQLCEYPLHRQADSQPLRHQGSPKLVCFKKVKKMSFFWPCHVAYGILIPQPGIKPVPPAWGACSLHHRTAREVPKMS